MDTKKLPPALLVALGLAGCGDDDEGPFTTGACLDFAPMTESASSSGGESGTETTTGPCLGVTPMSETSSSSGTGSESDSGDSTSVGPCLDVAPGTSTGGSESSGGSTGADAASERDDVLRSLVGRGILPDDVAAKLEDKR